MKRTRRFIASTKNTDTNAKMRPYPLHIKAWYPNEIQATSSRTVRGNIHSPSSILPRLPPVCHEFDRHHSRHPTGLRPRGLSNSEWHHLKMLAVHASKLCTLTRTLHTSTTEHKMQKKWCRFVNPHIIRSSSWLCLCPCRRILVAVNLYSRHNPKHSSKVHLPPV